MIDTLLSIQNGNINRNLYVNLNIAALHSQVYNHLYTWLEEMRFHDVNA